jgi:hypothetical protein
MTDKKDIEATPENTHRLRLPVRTEAPPKKVLDEMMSECQRNPSRLIELPVEIPGFAEGFRLTVERELGGSRPIWNLYAGEGATNRTLWTYTLTDTDMICEVLSLSVSSPPPPTPDVPLTAPSAPPQPEITAGAWPAEIANSEPSVWKQGAPPSVKPTPPPAAAPAEKLGAAKEEIKPIYSETVPLMDKAGPNILLGQIMVDSGLLPEPVLDAALSLQEMVRQGNLTSDDATDALRRMHKHGISLQDAIDAVKQKKQDKSPADVVELLRKSGIVSDDDISKARNVVEQMRKADLQDDRGREKDKTAEPIRKASLEGDKAPEKDKIVEPVRKSGHEDDKGAEKGKIAEQIRKAGLEGDKGAENGKILLDLLRLAGFITDEDIKRASTAGSSRPSDVCKSLLSSGAIDALLFEVASRFVKHVRLSTFKQEQAIIALHYSQRMRTNFEDTVHSLGWKVPIEN